MIILIQIRQKSVGSWDSEYGLTQLNSPNKKKDKHNWQCQRGIFIDEWDKKTEKSNHTIMQHGTKIFYGGMDGHNMMLAHEKEV